MVTARKITLEIIHVQSPCTQDWATMTALTGDGTTRFCGVCQKNVYDLSGMSRAAAEQLVATREGRLCVRFFKREDGTVVTADCSALRKAARRVKRTMATVAAGIIALITGILGVQATRGEACLSPAERPPATAPANCLVIPDGTSGPVIAETKGEMVMGDIAGPIVPVKMALPPPAPPASQPATQP